VGAGVDLITACDIRYCSAGARFCVKEVDIAIVADMGTLQRLPGIVGQGPSTVHIERLSSSDVSHQLWLVLFTMQFYTLSHSSRVVYNCVAAARVARKSVSSSPGSWLCLHCGVLRYLVRTVR